MQSYNPHGHAHGFGLFRVRSPLLTESLLVFFSSAYLDVSVRRVCDCFDGSSNRQVSPFGHQRINGRLHLPVAFRSLPRPSSPPGAKASPIRPYFASNSFCVCPNQMNQHKKSFLHRNSSAYDCHQHHALASLFGSITFAHNFFLSSFPFYYFFFFPVLSMNSL